MRVVLAAGLALLLAPVAQAEPVPTDLFFHVISVQDMPINTQMPPDIYADDHGYGPGATMRCLHGTTGDILGTGLGTAGSTSQAYHTYRAFAHPALVRYDDLTESGHPRTMPSRGLQGDAVLDAEAPMHLHWFLRSTPGAEGAPAPPQPTSSCAPSCAAATTSASTTWPTTPAACCWRATRAP